MNPQIANPRTAPVMPRLGGHRGHAKGAGSDEGRTCRYDDDGSPLLLKESSHWLVSYSYLVLHKPLIALLVKY